MEPIVVEVRRNGAVEARHLVHAVVVQDGEIVAVAGDETLTCFMRSSSKPLQALPLARARADLDSRDLAIASASHRATPEQIAARLDGNVGQEKMGLIERLDQMRQAAASGEKPNA